MLSIEELNAAAAALYNPVENFEPASNIDHAELLVTWCESLGNTVTKEFVRGRGKNPSFYRVTVTTPNEATWVRASSFIPVAITSAILFYEGVDNV